MFEPCKRLAMRTYSTWTLLLLLSGCLTTVSADKSQLDCQANEVFVVCGQCEGTCKKPFVKECRTDCRPARCECQSRDGYVRAHDGACIHISECLLYHGIYLSSRHGPMVGGGGDMTPLGVAENRALSKPGRIAERQFSEVSPIPETFRGSADGDSGRFAMNQFETRSGGGSGGAFTSSASSTDYDPSFVNQQVNIDYGSSGGGIGGSASDSGEQQPQAQFPQLQQIQTTPRFGGQAGMGGGAAVSIFGSGRTVNNGDSVDSGSTPAMGGPFGGGGGGSGLGYRVSKYGALRGSGGGGNGAGSGAYLVGNYNPRNGFVGSARVGSFGYNSGNGSGGGGRGAVFSYARPATIGGYTPQPTGGGYNSAIDFPGNALGMGGGSSGAYVAEPPTYSSQQKLQRMRAAANPHFVGPTPRLPTMDIMQQSLMTQQAAANGGDRSAATQNPDQKQPHMSTETIFVDLSDGEMNEELMERVNNNAQFRAFRKRQQRLRKQQQKQKQLMESSSDGHPYGFAFIDSPVKANSAQQRWSAANLSDSGNVERQSHRNLLHPQLFNSAVRILRQRAK